MSCHGNFKLDRKLDFGTSNCCSERQSELCNFLISLKLRATVEASFFIFCSRLTAITTFSRSKTGNCSHSDCGKIDSLHRELTTFLIQLSIFDFYFFNSFFWRQWKSISMFWCFLWSIVSLWLERGDDSSLCLTPFRSPRCIEQ